MKCIEWVKPYRLSFFFFLGKGAILVFISRIVAVLTNSQEVGVFSTSSGRSLPQSVDCKAFYNIALPRQGHAMDRTDWSEEDQTLRDAASLHRSAGTRASWRQGVVLRCADVRFLFLSMTIRCKRASAIQWYIVEPLWSPFLLVFCRACKSQGCRSCIQGLCVKKW